jgi:hypothetical protein
LLLQMTQTTMGLFHTTLEGAERGPIKKGNSPSSEPFTKLKTRQLTHDEKERGLDSNKGIPQTSTNAKRASGILRGGERAQLG